MAPRAQSDDVAAPTVHRGQPFIPEPVRLAIAEHYVLDRRVEIHGSYVPIYWFYAPRPAAVGGTERGVSSCKLWFSR